MKILLVQDYLRNGGTERQTLLLAHGFQAAGHATRLLTFRPGGTLAPLAADLDHRPLQRRDWHLDWWAPGLARAARGFAPDIVLTMGRMANCRGAQLQSAVPRAAVLATMRTGKTLPLSFVRSLAKVRHVVANSRAAADRLAHDYRVPREHLSVIHNSLVFPPGTSRRPRPASAEKLRRDHGASAATTVFLCVAMFRPEKNQRALLSIVRDLPPDADWQLWLGGTGPALAACRQQAQRLGLTDRVKFLGFQADPTPLYAAADLAVLTSTRESLSNFLIEAQAHGLPAVAYAAQGVDEAMLPGESGQLIEQGDERAFRTTLAELIASPTRCEAMSTAAATFARAHFAPDRQIQAYLDLFHRLSHPATP